MFSRLLCVVAKGASLPADIAPRCVVLLSTPRPSVALFTPRSAMRAVLPMRWNVGWYAHGAYSR